MEFGCWCTLCPDHLPALVDEGSISRSDTEGYGRGLGLFTYGERVPEEGPPAGLAGVYKQGPCCSQK